MTAALDEVRDEVLQCHDPLSQACARRSFARLFTSARRRGLAKAFRFTPREIDVAWLMAMGLTYAEVGAELSLTVSGVKCVVLRVFRRMNVTCRERAILKMILVSGALLQEDGDDEPLREP